MDAFQILVIVLSSVLALCLVVGLIAGIFMVLILKQVKHIAEKASEVADNVEVASEFFKNTSISGAAFKMFANAADFVKKHTPHKKEK
jgi:hypothetical protein